MEDSEGLNHGEVQAQIMAKSKVRLVTHDYSFMEDQYVKAWLTGLSTRTQANYRKQFLDVLAFLSVTYRGHNQKGSRSSL
jgi:hypothetical protein